MKIYLVSDSNCNIVELRCPTFYTRNDIIRFAFSVGDTTRGRFTISIEQDKIESVALNTLISVVTNEPDEFEIQPLQVQVFKRITGHLEEYIEYTKKHRKMSCWTWKH